MEVTALYNLISIADFPRRKKNHTHVPQRDTAVPRSCKHSQPYLPTGSVESSGQPCIRNRHKCFGTAGTLLRIC